ncbi:hypothetical protein TNCV_468291 [Trichonephila clavipes]|nr:hypothetical protein TNCV_468291 [Trichonephila clavipes]
MFNALYPDFETRFENAVIIWFRSIPTSLWPPPAKKSVPCACSEPWVHFRENFTKQKRYTRSVRDGPRNFKQWGGRNLSCSISSNFYTTPMGGRFRLDVYQPSMPPTRILDTPATSPLP